jgi:branched-chain amino acid transport system permease protein
MYASYVTYITPANFVITVAILILAAVVLGGMGRLSGVTIGAFAVVMFPEVFRDFEQERFLVFGATLVLMMILRPQGLLPARAHTYRLPSAAEPSSAVGAGTTLANDDVPKVLLECRDVTRRFGGLTAVNRVSFDVPEGSIFAVIGPNGAGKSTLFDLISGMQRPTSGQIRFRGQSVVGLAPHARTRLGMARTFQLIRLFTASSVAENVLVGMDAHQRSSALAAIVASPGYRRGERESLARVAGILEFCGIRALASEAAGNLSYGDQRRVEIARALATQPRLLLLDEPAAGMNPIEKRGLATLVRAIRDAGTTVVIIEHDMSLIMDLCDEVLVLDHGLVIAHGSPDNVSHDRAVVEAYLGVDAA